MHEELLPEWAAAMLKRRQLWIESIQNDLEDLPLEGTDPYRLAHPQNGNWTGRGSKGRDRVHRLR